MFSFRIKMAVKRVGILALAAFLLTACRDEDEPQPLTITDVVANSENFTLLEAAVLRAGLADALRTGSLTVFAPTDEAFRAAGFADAAAISAASPQMLQSILQYHAINNRVPAGALPIADNAPQQSLLSTNGTLFISRNNEGVTVNGARVIQPDVAASNGVIHVINRVLMPPTQSIVELAQGNPNFSLLVAAVLRAGTNVLTALTTNAPNGLTVFAPTNAAFQAAGFANEAAINAANPATLATILTYHVVPGRVFSTLVPNGADVTTAQGGTIRTTVSTTGGVTLLGRGNNNQVANVTTANLLTTNGVVHIIDRLLLP